MAVNPSDMTHDKEPFEITAPIATVESRSLFERVMETLPDGVLLVDADRKFLYANPAFAKHWSIPPRLIGRATDAELARFVAHQLVDPEGFIYEIEQIHSADGMSQDEVYFKDGRIFSRRSVPFERDGALHARIWIFTDVTEAHSATVDILTGVPNRRAYARAFPPYVAAADDGQIRSVALLDIDNFKTYNDLYGHAAGDTVLEQIGPLLQSHLRRADDLLFRIGGEEFLMAVRTDSETDALAHFQEVRGSIAALATTHAGNPPHGRVTASLGVGSFHRAMEAGDVFERVDAALYRAKANGRNALVAVDF
jgi:diguanylate cyclase (GGDEF)-like protein